jgi:tripartite-type tricarboxylate transporter receptor subunit TctC
MLTKFFCVVLLLLSAGALAQSEYPIRPVTMVVVTAPGGGMDITARALADGLGRKLGQTFVVENRPSAGGVAAAEYVARSSADGYTLLMGGNSTHSASPHLFRSIKYDPIRDFKPVARLATAGAVILVSSKSHLHSTADLLREAKASPDRFNYGSPNLGGQIVGEKIKRSAGIQMLRVPYRGTPQAITDVIAGTITLTVADAAAALGALTSGQVRALAISSAQRSMLLPAVPTLQEQGFADFDVTYWNGMFAPAATPVEVVVKLGEALRELLQDKTIRERIITAGLDPAYLAHDQMDAYVQTELSRWGNFIREAGIEPN